VSKPVRTSREEGGTPRRVNSKRILPGNATGAKNETDHEAISGQSGFEVCATIRASSGNVKANGCR